MVTTPELSWVAEFSHTWNPRGCSHSFHLVLFSEYLQYPGKPATSLICLLEQSAPTGQLMHSFPTLTKPYLQVQASEELDLMSSVVAPSPMTETHSKQDSLSPRKSL